MGNLIIPMVDNTKIKFFLKTRNPDVIPMPRIIQEYRDEVRKKIVEAAYDLFLQKGYHATTMSAIADSLGVTKPALYQYFPGKEELYACRCRTWS